jgi:hypothetical protein
MFEVLPKFSATPEEVDFGTVRRNTEVKETIQVRYGLHAPSTLEISGGIDRSSNPSFAQTSPDHLAHIQAFTMEVRPGDVITRSVTLVVPKSALWGDQEGRIVLKTQDGTTTSVKFRFHIPSLWERIRWFLALIVVVVALFVFYMTVIWGWLGTPRGILICQQVPEGVGIPLPIRLGEVKRGIPARVFNYRRNKLSLGVPRSEISLRDLSPSTRTELSFWRFGRPAYVRNLCPSGHREVISVSEEGQEPYAVRPGTSFGLGDGAVLIIGDYRFLYKRGT